ncbi:hypothetical protein KR018_005653, partial [Drosophila ironensis]
FREQQLLSIFEIIITTLEGKLTRIEHLDKNVDLLMQHIESLESRLTNNIVKTDLIISQLLNIESIITKDNVKLNNPEPNIFNQPLDLIKNSSNIGIKDKIARLDDKVTSIDNKLESLKVQLDNNFLQVEDFNGEASEKKSVTLDVNDIAKSKNTEAFTHITSELNELRDTTDKIDKKLQFQINIVSENIGKMMHMLHDIYLSVVNTVNTVNITQNEQHIKPNKFLDLFNQSLSEKMDEVWHVVIGAKSTVDHLLPKSEVLLSQTQRQERAIDEIHQDLKAKTNLIINNLDMVEKRLQKQDSNVTSFLHQDNPVENPRGVLIDSFLEFNPSNYSLIDEHISGEHSNFSTSIPDAMVVTNVSILHTTTSNPEDKFLPQSRLSQLNEKIQLASGSTTNGTKSVIRKGGIIFPSIKNKPAIINNTLNIDILSLKDIKGFSCFDLLNSGMKQSGVFYLQIRGTTYWFLKVYCDQETSDGGWTVIQRRDDFGEPRENFNRDWADYKNGFGEPAKEFWLGNENIYMLTNNEEYMLRVELEDFEGNRRYAQYSHFKIHAEADYYKLEIDGYEGNAGDSLNDPWYGSNNSPFSTYNKDNDRSSLNCASMLKGGWWWKSCGRGLNGLYLHDPQDLTARQGIVWFRWRGWDYTLKKSTMMIRPKIPQQQSMSTPII